MNTGGKNRPRLLVLDTGKYQKLFDAVLGQQYELLATENARDAITIASSESPDLVLLNYILPENDGIEVAKGIRQSASIAMPILLMLSKDMPTLRQKATKAGCSGFLIKPIDPKKLRDKIEHLLNGKCA